MISFRKRELLACATNSVIPVSTALFFGWKPGVGRNATCLSRVATVQQSVRMIYSIIRRENYSGIPATKDLVTLHVESDGVGVIALNSPPVNALTYPVLTSLKEKFEDAIRNNDIKAIVLFGLRGRFSAGFDIKAIKELQATGDASVMRRISLDLMTHTIEEASKPTVAAVDGIALGGGLELAMACSSRLSTANAQLGLPELTLGVIPSFGGTQRLPRLAGLRKATEMILSSEPISGEEAHRVGLVDGLLSSEHLLLAARNFAVDMAEGREPWCFSLTRTDKLESLSEVKDIISHARESVKRQSPNLSHPLVALDAIEEGIVSGGYAGAVKELEGFSKTVFSDDSRGLINVFFSQRSVTKVAGITDLGLQPQAMKQVAVIGGGVLGSEIATALALSGTSVYLKETSTKSLEEALARVEANLQSQMKDKAGGGKKEKAFALLKGKLDYDGLNAVDAVIEAVEEEDELKQDLFVDLVKHTTPKCLLASSTCSIDLEVIAAKTESHDRIVGAHFFRPAYRTPLLEVVRTEKSSPQCLVDLLHLAKLLKKTPVVVGNCVGFAVNRLLFSYNRSALQLLNLGVDPFRVDSVAKSFGTPMGPFAFADMVGIDVAAATNSQLMEAYPDRGYDSHFFSLLVKAGRLGKKTGKGVYRYDESGAAIPDPDIRDYAKEAQRLARIMPSGKPVDFTDEVIVEMLFFSVVNESARLLEERIVSQAADLDIASVLGMGFPRYRGGIIFWADLKGIKYIVEKLYGWSKLYGNGSLFDPCNYLVHRATNGVTLSDAMGRMESKAKL